MICKSIRIGLICGLLVVVGATAADQDPDRSQSLQTEVQQVGAAFSFTVVSGRAPRLMFLKRRALVTVELRNDSSVVWKAGRGIRLSYHWLTREGDVLEWDGTRTALKEPVPPDGTVTVAARVEPPLKVGTYGFQWDMVEEKVGWFSRRDPSSEPIVRVLVLPHLERTIGTVVPIVAALAALLLVVLGRGAADQTGLICLGSSADLLWLGLALLAKPFLLYSEAGLIVKSSAHIVSLGLVAVAVLLLAVLPSRVRPVVAWISVLAVSTYIWGEILYFRFFDDLASFSSVLAAPQTGELGDSIRYLAAPSDLVLAVDLALAVPLVVLLGTSQCVRKPPPRWCRVAIRVGLLVLLIPGLVVISGLIASERESFRRTRPPRRVVSTHGLYGYQVRDVVVSLERRLLRSPLGEEDLEVIAEWFRERSSSRQGAGSGFGSAAGANVVMVQVESMQQFLLGLEVNGQEITPNLNRLQRQAVVFTEFHDQTSKGRSSDADFISMVSVLPVADSVGYEYSGNDFTSIAHLLRERGYHTLSAIPFKRHFWNRQVTLPAYGFEISLFKEDFEPGDRIGWGLNDREFLRQIVPRIAALPSPFCVWLATLSLHYPFASFPDRYKELDLGRWEETSLGNYLHGMHLFDRGFGELLDGLGNAGLDDNTLVVLWGDHDSGLHLRREFDEFLGIRRQGLDRFLADRVPFMIWVPGADTEGSSIDLPAGHLDITPTLLAILGTDPQPYAYMGRNLLGEPGSEPVAHPRGSWFDKQLVFLSTDGGLDTGSCWDRSSQTQVPVQRCREGNEKVREQMEVAESLLIYDLQRTIGARLRLAGSQR